MTPETEYRRRSLPPNYRILNVGCGDDTFGTQRVDFAGGRGVTEIGFATQLPFKDEVFDEGFGSNVLEQMPNLLLFVQDSRCRLNARGGSFPMTEHASYLR